MWRGTTRKHGLESVQKKQDYPIPWLKDSRLALVELTRLGDALSIIPALQCLHSCLPSTEILTLVDHRFESLLQALCPYAGVVGIREPMTLRGILAALRVLRSRRIDLACSMSPARRNATVTLGSGSPKKVGYLANRYSRTPFLETTSVRSIGFRAKAIPPFSNANLYSRATRVCAALGLPIGSSSGSVRIPDEMLRPIRVRLQGKGLPVGKRYVVVHPFAGWEFRAWSMHHVVALAKRLVNELSFEVVIIGTREDFAGSAASLAGLGLVHTYPSDDLLESATLVSDADLFIGTDSGPLHMAANIGTQIVGLYGPAPIHLTAPHNGNGRYLYHQLLCSPCTQKKCVRPHDSCMGLITADEVFRAASQLVSSSPSTTSVAHAEI
jgi:ADP-heptose:LPS heptosyltransferase